MTSRVRGGVETGSRATATRAGHGRRRRALAGALAAALALGVVAAACSSSGSGGSANGGSTATSYPEPQDPPNPKPGGTVTYGIEAITTDFCLPSAQLAIAGVMVAQSIYDTLTRPDASGRMVPYLARSVTHDPTSTFWTIGLRPNVQFTDGEPVDAAAVAQNIDAWRNGILLGFLFKPITNVQVVDPLTVKVTMSSPWVAFDQYLWSFGRVGIAAPAQLDNQATCSTNMIGSGPFKLKSFDPISGNVDVVRNPNYWYKPYPYLDEIKFVPIPDGSQLVTTFQGGGVDVLHNDNGVDLTKYQAMGNQASMWMEQPGREEIGHMLLDVSRPPLNDLGVRTAIAQCANRPALNQIQNAGQFRIANGVLDFKVLGYVQNAGYPKYDPVAAKKFADQWRAQHGAPITFNLQSTNDSETVALAAAVQAQAAKCDIKVNLPTPTDQATIINQAIGGSVDAFLWRNYAGQDPDTLYVWFHSGSPVNFNHLADPEVDHDLEMGRATADPAQRAQFYQDFDRRLSSQVYNLWTWYQQWFVVTKPDVHGVFGPNLPDADGNPGTDPAMPMLAGYHQLLGMWKS